MACELNRRKEYIRRILESVTAKEQIRWQVHLLFQ